MASPALVLNGSLPKNILNGGSGGSAGAAGGSGSISLEGPSGAITPAKTIAGNAFSTPSMSVPMKSSLGTTNLGNSPSLSGAVTGSGGGLSSQLSSKRLDVDSIMVEFQKLLGDNWDRYRDVITNFLVGSLTRFELQEELDQILDKTTIKLHNHFLLANLANSLRDPPPGEHGSLSGWFKKHKDGARNVKGDSQLAKLKEDILGLSVRERKRIKAIARESGKRAPIPSTVTATRQAMLPKIPFINEKDKAKLQNGGSGGSGTGGTANGGSRGGSTSVTPRSPGKQGATGNGTSSPAPESGSAGSSSSSSTHLANPMIWTQDIIHSYETPLASETFELPDNDSLNARMLGISLEHGLLHGIDNGTTDIMVAGLEHYLKDIVQQIFDKARLRKTPNPNTNSIFGDTGGVIPVSGTSKVITSTSKSVLNGDATGLVSSSPQPTSSALSTSLAGSFEDIMSIEDMALALDTAPHGFVEMNGPVYRLKNVMLYDEEPANPSERAPIPMFNPHIESQPEIANLLRDIMSS